MVRNEHLRALAELTRKTGGTVIAGGDFNITPWSPNWREFQKHSGLLEARKGMALAPSWPHWLPVKARIPIDHILVSPDVNVLGVGIGEATGSDHAPIVADLSL
jgi:endonuclease/exonuclease/phosphatase (EEP) superfamily protein YafD